MAEMSREEHEAVDGDRGELGCLLLYLVLWVAFALAVIYGIVRFVKWAWG